MTSQVVAVVWVLLHFRLAACHYVMLHMHFCRVKEKMFSLYLHLYRTMCLHQVFLGISLRFTIRAVLNGQEYPPGVGKNKKEAKKKAAENVMKALQQDPLDTVRSSFDYAYLLHM